MGDFRNTPTGVGNLGFVPTGGFEFGDIEYNGDVDVFQTVLVGGLNYTIEQRGSATGDGSLSDPILALVNINNTTIVSDDDSGVGLNAQINYTPPSSIVAYLSARDFGNNNTGDYTVSVSAGRGTAGADVVTATAYADAIEGLGGADNINGAGGEDTLYGGDGNDQLRGGSQNDFIDGGRNNDTVRGQAGDDLISGGFDADIIIGGSGADRFFYNLASGSTPGARDQYRAGDGGLAFDGAGNAAGDRFDLINIDANTTAGGDQAFIFGGTTQTGKGRIWLSNSGSDTIVHGNTDNDAAAEWQVEIEDGAGVTASSYTANDFFL